MKKTASVTRSSYFLLQAVVAGLLIILLAALFLQVFHLRKDLDAVKAESSVLYNEIDYQKSLSRPVVAARDNQVVFPELKIALPYNDVTKTLQYSVDDRSDVGASVTSTLLTDHKVRQMNCSQLVRFTFTDGHPFSPWEESAGSVRLADGRTLYMVAAKAFRNKEASTLECAAEVWHNVTPARIVEEFKKAQTY
jgi:hypothetical protein